MLKQDGARALGLPDAHSPTVPAGFLDQLNGRLFTSLVFPAVPDCQVESLLLAFFVGRLSKSVSLTKEG